MKMSHTRLTKAGYSVLRMSARRIPPWVLRAKGVDLVILRRERAQPPPESAPIRWASPHDVAQIEELAGLPAGVYAQLARGGLAVVWVERDEVLGCTWFEPTARLHEGWLQFVLTDAQRWISYTYVSPDERGRGISGHLGEYALSSLQPDVTCVAGVSSFLNTASRRASEKVGFDILRIWYIRVFGLTVLRGAQRWRFGRWRASRPLRVSLSEIQRTRQHSNPDTGGP